MKHTRLFYTFVFFFFILILLLFTVRPSGDPDFLRHIKLGELIWQTKHFVRYEPFVSTTFHTPLLSPNWLFDLILYLVYRSGGFVGIALFKTGIAFLIFYFILKILQRKRVFWVAAFALIYIFSSRLLPRPDLLSLLFFSIYLFLLMRHEEKSAGEKGWIGWKKALVILCVHVLWVNIHSFYVLGLTLLFLYLGGRVIERNIGEKDEYTWLGFLLLLAGASLANPDGYRNFQVIWDQVSFARKDSFYNLLDIVELRSPLFSSTPAFKLNFFFLIIVSGLTFVADALVRRRMNRFFPIWVFFLLFSLLSLRSSIYFCLLAVPLAAYNFYALKDVLKKKTERFGWLYRWQTSVALQLFAVGFLLFAFRLPLWFTYQEIKKNGFSAYAASMTSHSFNEMSEEALRFIQDNDLPDPILNTYNNGSALYFHCYPKKVFIDSRGAQGGLIKDYLFFLGRDSFKEEDIPRYRILLDTYGIKTVVFPAYNVAVARMLYYVQGWELVYLDNTVYIFCRRDAVKAALIRPRRAWYAWAHEKAGALYTKVLTEQEGDELNTYARIFLFLNMFEEARELLFTASAAVPWDSGYAYNLSLCYFLQQDFSQAYLYAYKAYEIDPASIKHKVGLLLAAQAQGISGVEKQMRSEILDFSRAYTDAFEAARGMFKFALHIDIAERMSGTR